MLLIKTRIGVSSTHGIGLFAAEFIPKGTVTWEYHPNFDLSFTDEQVTKLPEVARKSLMHYSFFDTEIGKYVIPIDDLRFINHSEDQSRINIESTPHNDIAKRDIKEGEELFCDYNKFDDTYFDRIGLAKENLL
ncbi:MAG: SET domain-containing protein [Candidatus Paceibacterota bacterium]